MNAIAIRRTHRAQYLIFIQAILAMVGSLYYQYYGDPVVHIMAGNIFATGAGFIPCILCRWARVLMYPITWMSLISIRKKDLDIVDYIFPVSIMGIVLELYHYLLQKTTWLDAIGGGTFCTKANPCAASQSVNYFGFMTIPFLCLIAFVVICIACIIIKRYRKKQLLLHHTSL